MAEARSLCGRGDSGSGWTQRYVEPLAIQIPECNLSEQSRRPAKRTQRTVYGSADRDNFLSSNLGPWHSRPQPMFNALSERCPWRQQSTRQSHGTTGTLIRE